MAGLPTTSYDSTWKISLSRSGVSDLKFLANYPRLCYRCLQKDPNRRYQTPGELAAALSSPSITDWATLVALYDATNGTEWIAGANWLRHPNSFLQWSGVNRNIGYVGSVEKDVSHSDRVIRLVLGKFGLRGRLPHELGNLTSLEWLDLSINRINGELRQELEKLVTLTRLRHLDLSRNNMTGEIPHELGNLASLEQLVLSGNKLIGEIPHSLTELTKLEWLILSENSLAGRIPDELGNLTNLRHLDLSGNQLTGEIPRELGNLTNLRHLDLSGNQLTGEIPRELGNLTNLQHLDLIGNQLTGEIPRELCNLTTLRCLDLASNMLSGELPSELGNLISLVDLDLTGNEFIGQIPDEWYQGLYSLNRDSLMYLDSLEEEVRLNTDVIG